MEAEVIEKIAKCLQGVDLDELGLKLGLDQSSVEGLVADETLATRDMQIAFVNLWQSQGNDPSPENLVKMLKEMNRGVSAMRVEQLKIKCHRDDGNKQPILKSVSKFQEDIAAPVSSCTDAEATKHSSLIPLCYPDNFDWCSEDGVLTKKRDESAKLTVCEDALNVLKSLKGHVCVVTVLRDSKSGESGRERHTGECLFRPKKNDVIHQRGLWMRKETLSRKLKGGDDVTVVFLEAIDDRNTSTQNVADIFTLSCLLSSMLIFTTDHNPTADDLQKLGWICKLKDLIKMKQKNFFRFFPHFVWVVNDFAAASPATVNGNSAITRSDFLLNNVLQFSHDNEESSKFLNDIIMALLTYFPTFGAQDVNTGPEIHQSSQHRHEDCGIDKCFTTFCEQTSLHLRAKKAWPDVGNVDAESLVGLIKGYTSCLNKGRSPIDVKAVFDGVAISLVRSAAHDAFLHYSKQMKTFVNDMTPCDEALIIKEHGKCFSSALQEFQEKTQYVTDSDLLAEHRRKLAEDMAVYNDDNDCGGGLLSHCLQSNSQQSEAFCFDLALGLEDQKLKPLIRTSATNKELTFEDFESVVKDVETAYFQSARGPYKYLIYRTVLVERFTEFYYEGEGYLQNLKNYKPTSEIDSLEKSAFEYGAAAEEKVMKKTSELMKYQMQTEARTQISKEIDGIDRERDVTSADFKERLKALHLQCDNLRETHVDLVEELELFEEELDREHLIMVTKLEIRKRDLLEEKDELEKALAGNPTCNEEDEVHMSPETHCLIL